MIQPYTTQRTIKFEGDHMKDDLLIGNFGDVEFVANGQFDLSGMIYCPKGEVEFDVEGTGAVSFNGVCHRLVVKNASGNCKLDFSQLTCKEVRVLSMKGESHLILGAARLIREAVLSDEALMQCSNKSIIINYSVTGKSQIERMPKIAS